MSKKKNRYKEYKIDGSALQENEVILYGSTNGWLRTVASGGVEMMFVPDKHEATDEPSAWYLIGKYRLEELVNA